MPSAAPSPKKILVVDDEPSIVAMATRFLTIEGYVARGVASAQEGLRLLESEGWDLVITDRAMPEMDGEEFADLIRQRAPKMPIIMITGFPGAVTRLECVDLVLRKPFAPSELLTLVARMLAK